MKTSVVIPAFNNYKLLHQLLLDITKQKGDKSLLDIIVVNDCSDEEGLVGGLNWWKNSKLHSLQIVNNPHNLGFLLTSNTGLKMATGDIVILISTDVRLYGNVLEEIEKRLSEYPKTLISGKVYRETTGWNNFDGKIFSYAEGFLLATTREGWEELGYFDPIYVPHDFEDVDISTTAISKGYELWQLPADIVQHLGAQSIGYSSEREALTARNKEKFRKKWVENE